MVDDWKFLALHGKTGVGRYDASWPKIEAEWYTGATPNPNPSPSPSPSPNPSPSPSPSPNPSPTQASPAATLGPQVTQGRE